MTPEEFQKLYPVLAGWIETTLGRHAAMARSVASLGFKRLPLYYSQALLVRAKFVPVPRCPTPPLASLGLEQFRAFEEMDAAGITYLDTYFVQQEHLAVEHLHFHELVHVVQWLTLGPERFMKLYADGLERHGYRNSPLEVMAYDAEDEFKQNGKPFDAEQRIRDQLRRLA